MRRTEFLSGSLAFAALAFMKKEAFSRKQTSWLMSVSGKLTDPGRILPHEHILVDFIGAGKVSPARYDAGEVFETALPKLKELKLLGCDTLIECTPDYLGRDVKLLKRLSEASGMNILTNTGYYGAREHMFLPDHVHEEDAGKLADRWTDEWENGIGDTGIRPGFIKTGADKAPLSALQRKIVRAAARTHLRTGLTVGIHTGNGAAAEEELSILEAEGVSPEAFIWIHAQSENNHSYHLQLARKGAWVEFDGIREESLEEHLELVQTMKAHKLLGKVLVSQDAGWYHVGEAGGGSYRGYGLLFTAFIPLLKKKDFTGKEIETLVKTNPAEAFAIRIRKKHP